MMIDLKNIIIEDNTDKTYPFNHGCIKKPVKIFGQLLLGDDNKKLGLSFPKDTALENLLPAINEYLEFLSDCKTLLWDFYKEKNADIINEWFEGIMSEDWYETLEIYGAIIDFDRNGNPSGRFSCGDNMITDHLLCIEFNGREIAEMYFDG